MNNKRKTGMLATIFVITLMASVKLFSQAGGAAVPFLVISPDARGSGMGEVGTAIADDVNAIYWNPAGLGFQSYVDNGADPDNKTTFRQVSLSFSKWLPQFNADLFYSYGTFGQYIPDLDGTIGVNFTYMHLGEFTRTYESGLIGGKFLSNEFAFGLSYGTIIATDLAIGFQLRYIQSNLAPATNINDVAGTGRSGSFDIGLLWKPKNLDVFGLDLSDKIALGFNLQNVGPKVTYRNESDPLPTTLRLGSCFGVVKDEFNDLKLSLDISKLLVKRDSLGSDPLPKSLWTAWQNPGVEFAMGMEYWYSQVIALRLGYFGEPARLGNRQFWNFGASVRYEIFRLDFSFINTIEANHPLANTMRFSLLIDWK